ncbi:hypothetical protein [Azospirillum sp. TSA6c]|uniref:hypothetical protein n=1 Tax=unclassified Azospirillum TaxID=2630922 RepID=UPI000D6192D1|nr:hypothetical protein [Azospirillum sp. TSA6c]PWC48565.1 hypothetical protein TSA6c_19680 [Azospirillum sp. TSA6c]
MIDSGVNHGPARAGTWLQDAVNGADAAGLWRSVFAQRMRFYGQIITGDARKRGRKEGDALNAAGWLNRLAEFMEV